MTALIAALAVVTVGALIVARLQQVRARALGRAVTDITHQLTNTQAELATVTGERDAAFKRAAGERRNALRLLARIQMLEAADAPETDLDAELRRMVADGGEPR